MKKIIIFGVICILAVTCFSNFVYATDVDLNLNNDEGTSNLDSTVYGSTISEETTATTTTNPTTYSTTDATVSVGTTAAISSSSLSLSNILNIILIVLGILLVLFAIAILIRIR